MLLKLQRYQLNVTHVHVQQDEDFDDELEIMVQSTLADIPIKAVDWRRMQQATEDDPVL